VRDQTEQRTVLPLPVLAHPHDTVTVAVAVWPPLVAVRVTVKAPFRE